MWERLESAILLPFDADFYHHPVEVVPLPVNNFSFSEETQKGMVVQRFIFMKPEIQMSLEGSIVT